MRFLLTLTLVCSSLIIHAQAQVTITVTPTSCNGCCDGAASAIVTGCLVPDFTYLWNPNGAVNETIENLCEGVYEFLVVDQNGEMAQVTFTVIAGGGPYDVIENVLIDCASGGPLDLRIFSFPPTEGQNNGEACVVPPDCWVEPVSYTWFDVDQNVIGTSACITGVPSGNYNVLIIGDEGEEFSFEVPLFDGAPLELISQEVCPPNGIEESESLRFDFFPNPAYDHLLLTLNVPLIGLSYHIADVQGREVIQGRLNLATNRIELSTLSAGSYLVYLLDDTGDVRGAERMMVEE